MLPSCHLLSLGGLWPEAELVQSAVPFLLLLSTQCVLPSSRVPSTGECGVVERNLGYWWNLYTQRYHTENSLMLFVFVKSGWGFRSLGLNKEFEAHSSKLACPLTGA